jgi:hypothetical protein
MFLRASRNHRTTNTVIRDAEMNGEKSVLNVLSRVDSENKILQQQLGCV